MSKMADERKPDANELPKAGPDDPTAQPDSTDAADEHQQGTTGGSTGSSQAQNAGTESTTSPATTGAQSPPNAGDYPTETNHDDDFSTGPHPPPTPVRKFAKLAKRAKKAITPPPTGTPQAPNSDEAPAAPSPRLARASEFLENRHGNAAAVQVEAPAAPPHTLGTPQKTDIMADTNLANMTTTRYPNGDRLVPAVPIARPYKTIRWIDDVPDEHGNLPDHDGGRGPVVNTEGYPPDDPNDPPDDPDDPDDAVDPGSSPKPKRRKTRKKLQKLFCWKEKKSPAIRPLRGARLADAPAKVAERGRVEIPGGVAVAAEPRVRGLITNPDVVRQAIAPRGRGRSGGNMANVRIDGARTTGSTQAMRISQSANQILAEDGADGEDQDGEDHEDSPDGRRGTDEDSSVDSSDSDDDQDVPGKEKDPSDDKKNPKDDDKDGKGPWGKQRRWGEHFASGSSDSPQGPAA